jgi:hypothetical protein
LRAMPIFAFGMAMVVWLEFASGRRRR